MWKYPISQRLHFDLESGHWWLLTTGLGFANLHLNCGVRVLAGPLHVVLPHPKIQISGPQENHLNLMERKNKQKEVKRNQQGSKMDDTIGSQRCLHLQFSWVLNWSGVLNWATGYKLTPNSPGKFGLSINLTTNHFSKRMQKKKQQLNCKPWCLLSRLLLSNSFEVLNGLLV